MDVQSVIDEMEAEASELESIAKHGSPVTSMSEDHAMGESAKALRKYIEKLKNAEVSRWMEAPRGGRGEW